MSDPQNPGSERREILAHQTVTRIRDGIACGKLPVVPQIMELIRAISAKVDSISIQELADIIGQDPGIMARVIAIANKLAYNPAGVEIATIHQAISVVGFERIRNLAVSVMLAENVESALSAEENREVAGLALASGFLARELLSDHGFIDPEVAFVCAALRNYGRLMLTTFLLEDYERARALTPQLGADSAFREVFGLTPLELGRELLESEQLPEIIVNSMRQVPLQEIRKQALSPLEQLAATSEFTVRLFELFEEPKLDHDNFPGRAMQLAEQYVPGFKLGPKTILKHLQEVSLRCEELVKSTGSRGFAPPLFRRVEAMAENRPLPPVSILSRRIHAHPTIAPPPPASDVQSASDVLMQCCQQMADLIQKDPRNIEAVFQIFLDILHSQLNLEQSIIFLLDPAKTGCSARFGRGEAFQAIQGQTVIHRENKDIFGLCLERGEDILLQNPEDSKLRGHLPPWLLAIVRGNCLLLLALRDRKGVYGIVLGITSHHETITLVETLRSELVSLRAVLSRIGRPGK